MMFSRRVAHVINAEQGLAANGSKVSYRVRGLLFLAAAMISLSDSCMARIRQIIDLTHSQIWDAASIAALDTIITEYQVQGAEVAFKAVTHVAAIFIGA